MTKKQRITLMAELWPNACAAQGWNAQDRELRLLVCSIGVSDGGATGHPVRSLAEFLEAFHSADDPARVLKSANDIDEREDFTRVKDLMLLLADKVEIDSNRERTMRFVLDQQVKCLAIYLGNTHKAQAYVASIRAFNPELQNIIRTVNNRLHNKRNGFRVKAGDSMHDMCLKAGVKCICKECEGQRAKPPAPVNAVSDDPF